MYISMSGMAYVDIVVWIHTILIGIQLMQGIQPTEKKLDFSLTITPGGQFSRGMLEYIYALTRTRNSERP